MVAESLKRTWLREVRSALRVMVLDAYPECPEAELVVELPAGEFARVAVAVPADDWADRRWWERAAVYRRRLAASVGKSYPEAVRAEVICDLGDGGFAVLPVMLGRKPG